LGKKKKKKKTKMPLYQKQKQQMEEVAVSAKPVVKGFKSPPLVRRVPFRFKKKFLFFLSVRLTKLI